jgi:hypothetical protein
MTQATPAAPPVLRPVLEHAERFAEVLAARERHVSTRDRAALWLVGRAGELRCVVQAVTDDWRSGRLSPGQAAIDLALHLESIHRGFAEIVGRQTPLCCLELEEPTTTVLLRDLASAPCSRSRE